MPVVTISVVGFDSLSLLKPLLNLVKSTCKVSYKFVVVDNDSHDGTDGFFKNLNDPSVMYWRNQENLGFGVAQNQVAAGLDSPYMVILNPDVTWTGDLIASLVLGPLTGNVFCVGPSNAGCNLTPQFNGVKGKSARVGDYEYIEGCCMAIPKWVVDLNRGKLFDESCFMYGEDADFCLRMRRCGYSLATVPSTFKHLHRRTDRSKKMNLGAVSKKSTDMFKEKYKLYLERRNFEMSLKLEYGGPPERAALLIPVLQALKTWNTWMKIYVDTPHLPPGALEPYAVASSDSSCDFNVDLTSAAQKQNPIEAMLEVVGIVLKEEVRLSP